MAHALSTSRILWLGLVLLALFAAFTVATQPGGNASLDAHFGSLFHHLAGGARYRVFEPLQAPGSPLGSIVLTALVAAVAARRRGPVAAVIVISSMGAMTLLEGLLRIRLASIPWDDLRHFVFQPRGYHLVHSTYPSGHTARLGLLSATVALALVPRPWRVQSLAVAGIITAAIAVQRVAADQHSVTDVIGGALLGWGVACLAAWAIGVRWHLRLRRLFRGEPVPGPS